MKVTIGSLVMTMIEENSVESLVVAKVRHFKVLVVFLPLIICKLYAAMYRYDIVAVSGF